MGIADDIKEFTADTFGTSWDERDGQVVPDPEDLTLGNDAVKFDKAAIFYADLSGSTAMVDGKKWEFSAQIYKTFLNAAAKLIRHHDGEITAYDGDRVMGVFIGDYKRTNAVKCALQLNYATTKIIQPAINKHWTTDFVLRHTVGIDCSIIRAARTGVRGDNDIVWIGPAANHAAKLSDISAPPYATYITEDVYDNMDKSTRVSQDGRNMWQWLTLNEKKVYRSEWTWTV